MNQFDSIHIDVEPFDREYPIEELLPQDLLNRLVKETSPILPEQWALFTDGGQLHFKFGPWQATVCQQIATAIDTLQPEEDTTIDDNIGARALVMPIEYELEVKGYMAIYQTGADNTHGWKEGRAGVNLLKHLMGLKHQTMLTSGLHGMVVEESYAELKNKAEQLARSEEKYRLLSANLEVEVQKKTEEIRVTHAHLMQQEKMAAIGQLSAGMAHEINNPLGFILSNLSTLKSYGEDLATLANHYRTLASLCRDSVATGISPAIEAQSTTIQDVEQDLDGEFLLSDMPVLIEESVTGAERIKKIVEDLKAVARPGEFQKELINLHESIDAVLTIVENRMAQNVETRKSYGSTPLIYGHPQEISQIWLNLITNALDAMENQGILEIATKSSSDRVVVEIKDTGHGIPVDHLSKIFEPFFTTKDVGQGTGLGLHLVYHLATKHGGQVSVQSETGNGSVFTISLPANKG